MYVGLKPNHLHIQIMLFKLACQFLFLSDLILKSIYESLLMLARYFWGNVLDNLFLKLYIYIYIYQLANDKVRFKLESLEQTTYRIENPEGKINSKKKKKKVERF